MAQVFTLIETPMLETLQRRNQAHISELQTHPNLHSPFWVGRNDTDQTHPNLHPHTRVMTSHTGTNTPKFAPSRWGLLPYSNRAMQNSVVGLELAEHNKIESQQPHCNLRPPLSWSHLPPCTNTPINLGRAQTHTHKGVVASGFEKPSCNPSLRSPPSENAFSC